MIEKIKIEKKETNSNGLLKLADLYRLSQGKVYADEWPDFSLVVESLDKLVNDEKLRAEIKAKIDVIREALGLDPAAQTTTPDTGEATDDDIINSLEMLNNLINDYNNETDETKKTQLEARLKSMLKTLEDNLSGVDGDGNEISKEALVDLENRLAVAFKIHFLLPELFEGTLHDEFQGRVVIGVDGAITKARERLPALGDEANSSLGGYVIGINQTHVDQDSTIEAASKYLKKYGGVIAEDGFGRRFRAFSPDDLKRGGNKRIASQFITSGYYVDTTYGKFVVAVPSLGEETPLIDFGLQWTDAQKVINGIEVVSSKYVAYYIDGEGTVWKNNNFMINEEPDFEELIR